MTTDQWDFQSPLVNSFNDDQQKQSNNLQTKPHAVCSYYRNNVLFRTHNDFVVSGINERTHNKQNLHIV